MEENVSLQQIVAAGHINPSYAMAEAVSKDQSTDSKQELTDAKSTEIAVQEEEASYNYFYNDPNGPLQQDMKHINNMLQHGGSAGGIEAGEKQFNMDSGEANAVTSQLDGAVQSDQGQTSSDATNLQMAAQRLQSTNSLMTTLSNMLGRII